MDNTLQYLVIISKTKFKDKFIKLLTENGGKGLTTIYGKGSVNAGVLAQSFGLDNDVKRLVLQCLITTENAKNILQILLKKYNFNKPNTGMAFTIPVEGLMF